nr:hypothetical protein [Mycobacterium tuberculosis]
MTPGPVATAARAVLAAPPLALTSPQAMAVRAATAGRGQSTSPAARAATVALVAPPGYSVTPGPVATAARAVLAAPPLALTSPQAMAVRGPQQLLAVG